VLGVLLESALDMGFHLKLLPLNLQELFGDPLYFFINSLDFCMGHYLSSLSLCFLYVFDLGFHLAD